MTASQRAIFFPLVEERDDYMSCIVFDIWKFCFLAGQKEEINPPQNKKNRPPKDKGHILQPQMIVIQLNAPLCGSE